MKYIIRSINATKSWPKIIGTILIMMVSLAMNARILMYLSEFANCASLNEMYPVVVTIMVWSGAVTMLEAVSQFTRNYSATMYTWLMNRFSDKLLDSDPELFEHFSPGVIQNTGSNIGRFTDLVQTVINLVQNVITVVINVGAITIIAGWYSIPVVAIFTACGFGIAAIEKKIAELMKQFEGIKKERNIDVDEINNGFMDVRSFSGTTEYHRKRIYSLNQQNTAIIDKRKRWSALLNGMIMAVDTGGMAILMGFTMMSMYAGHPIASATVVALVMYGWRLINPVFGISDGLQNLSSLVVTFPLFDEIMNYPIKIHSGKNILDSFDNGIELTDVGFAYPGETSKVLTGINLRIHKGDSIGVCGETGQGKSSLLKLLLRFYDVTEGSIMIDGIDIRDMTLDSLRKYVGIVHQSPYIFDGTIRDNIVYAMRPNAVSDVELIEACKKAQIYDFIMGLPDQFETAVGPRGMKLSGGQKQRISLARIFLSNPEIVLLDEATSALDNTTERLVQDAIAELRGKTIITVAHRLSTIRDCDKIIVIDNHTIAESGTHDELIALDGKYAMMAAT